MFGLAPIAGVVMKTAACLSWCYLTDLPDRERREQATASNIVIQSSRFYRLLVEGSEEAIARINLLANGCFPLMCSLVPKLGR